MDIEDRAAKWARDYAREQGTYTPDFGEDDLIAAYLAGSAQTQRDYAGVCACTCCNCSGCLG
jgi:hypothetical protein